MRTGKRTGCPGRAGGFTYLFVLMLIALAGLGLAAAGPLWRTDAQREREAELLFVGQQYRQAIQRYYELQPGQPKLPPDVDALLEDRRTLPPTRHLRRAWPDPFGGNMQVIPAADGRGIVGVRSGSARTPLKRSGFSSDLSGFENAGSYAAWDFAFTPPPVAQPAGAVTPSPPSSLFPSS